MTMEREKPLSSSVTCQARTPVETTFDLIDRIPEEHGFVNAGRIVRKGECVMRYYVNKQAQSNGDHEVHKETCFRLPTTDNRLYLGVFSTSEAALREARKLYPKADGCYYCCPEIHHS